MGGVFFSVFKLVVHEICRTLQAQQFRDHA